MLGRHHPTIRRLRELRRDAAARRAEDVLVAEGVHVVLDALACGAAVELVLVSPALDAHADGPRVLDAVARAGVALERTGDALLGSLQDARGAQPVLAVVRRPRASLDELPAAPVLIGLAGVQDPANLGAVLRTAAAAGASGCLCDGTVDPFHPRAVRAAMGATFRMPLFVSPLDGWRALADRHGIPLIAADARGELTHDRAALDGGLLLAIGAEGAGLPRTLLDAADSRVRIALAGGVESLAVPAAAAVLLFECARQRAATR